MQMVEMSSGRRFSKVSCIRLTIRHILFYIRLFGIFEKVGGHLSLHILERPKFKTIEVKMINPVKNHSFLWFRNINVFLFLLLMTGNQHKQQNAREKHCFFHFYLGLKVLDK